MLLATLRPPQSAELHISSKHDRIMYMHETTSATQLNFEKRILPHNMKLNFLTVRLIAIKKLIEAQP